jgi:Fe-S oxidoreductase
MKPKGERFGDLRMEQAVAPAEVLVTACPYCIMFEDRG